MAHVVSGVMMCVLACGSDAEHSDDGTAGSSTDGEPGEAGSLIDPLAFSAVDGAVDPFAAHRPSVVDCDADGAHAEGSTFEILTDFCNYAGFVQPSLLPVSAGDRIHLYVFHETLAADVPAQAHVAVQLGPDVLWEKMIEIPNTSVPYSVEVEAPRDQPAGTDVHLHLHNHGYNTWKLVTVAVEPQ